MIARDEEDFLPCCLTSARDIVDEIIVVDTGSQDNTIKIAKKFGAKIIQAKWNGNYSKARNISLKEAQGDWIVVLDSDQTIARRDLPKIKSLLKKRGVAGFRFFERDYCNDYNLLRNWQMCQGQYETEERYSGCKGWVSIPVIHLFQNRKGISYGSCTEHTSVDDSINKIKGKVQDTDIAIHHFQCLKGKDYIRKKQLRALKGCVEKSLKKYPNNPTVHYNISIGLFSFKRDDCGAIKHAKRAIELNPAFRDAYNLLGMIHLERNEHGKSLSPLLYSLALDPGYSDTYCLLGIAYDGQGQIDKAIKYCRQALRLKPFHPFAHNSLGVCYLKKGWYQKALSEFKRAVEILPHYKYAKDNAEVLIQQFNA